MALGEQGQLTHPIPVDSHSDLLEIIAVTWASRWLVLAMIICCTLLAGLAALLVPRKYDANVLLSPVTERTTSSGLGASLEAAASQLGGVASLVGLNLAGEDSSKAIAVATLQSEELTDQYIRDNDLLPILFANDWNAQLKRWDRMKPSDVPTLWKGNAYFKKHIRTVTEDAKTGLVTLKIRWKDPALAARWANGLIKLANDYMRNKAITESERDISFLNQEAAKTSLVELRTAIYQLMESEIRQEMLARGSDEYALRVIDPATAPERPAFPQPWLWMGGGAAFGFILGIVAATIQNSARNARMLRKSYPAETPISPPGGASEATETWQQRLRLS